MSGSRTLDRTPPLGEIRRAPGPIDRPGLAVRIFIGLVGLGALAFNAALMMSDRAPSFMRDAFGGFARRLSDRLDASGRAQVLTDGSLPDSDAIVHIGVWAVAAALVMLTVWTWRGLVISAIAVFTASVVIEAAQGVYTTTREVEVTDVMANALGVGLAAVFAGCCFTLWSAGAATVRSIRRR